jgi:hypothetical protein
LLLTMPQRAPGRLDCGQDLLHAIEGVLCALIAAS